MEVEASKEDQKRTVRELLRVQMKNALVSHGTAQMWYYHINYIPGSPHNLSNYLELPRAEYTSIMLALGLFTKKKQATDGLSIKKNEWQSFLIECGIDTMQLHCTQVKEICKRKIHWIGLGEYKCDKRYDVINQFDFYEDDDAETRNWITCSYMNEEQKGPKKLTSIMTYNSSNGSNQSNVNVQSTIRMLNRWYNDIATYVDKDGGKHGNETDNEEEEEHSERNPESATTKDRVSERVLKVKETLSTLSKIVVTFKKRYEELKNARPSHLKRVRRVVEEILRKWGIDRAAYHGGDLTGNLISKFCLNAEQIFGEIKEKLRTYVEDRHHGCLVTEEEVKTVCMRFEQLVLLLDGFFAIHMTTHSDYTPQTEVRLI